MKILVLGSSIDGNKENFPCAEELGELLSKDKSNHLIFGGCAEGTLGCVYKKMKEAGNEITAIVPDVYKYNLDNIKVNNIMLTQTLSERMDKMIDDSDATIVLPGGNGTVLEFIFALGKKRAGEYEKPIVVINSNGFYDKLIEFINSLNKEEPIQRTFFKAVNSARAAVMEVKSPEPKRQLISSLRKVLSERGLHEPTKMPQVIAITGAHGGDRATFAKMLVSKIKNCAYIDSSIIHDLLREKAFDDFVGIFGTDIIAADDIQNRTIGGQTRQNMIEKYQREDTSERYCTYIGEQKQHYYDAVIQKIADYPDADCFILEKEDINETPFWNMADLRVLIESNENPNRKGGDDTKVYIKIRSSKEFEDMTTNIAKGINDSIGWCMMPLAGEGSTDEGEKEKVYDIL